MPRTWELGHGHRFQVCKLSGAVPLVRRSKRDGENRTVRSVNHSLQSAVPLLVYFMSWSKTSPFLVGSGRTMARPIILIIPFKSYKICENTALGLL